MVGVDADAFLGHGQQVNGNLRIFSAAYWVFALLPLTSLKDTFEALR
jgi:hypothetical protein